MADRENVNRERLGELEDGERLVGCLHFRVGVTSAEAVRLWHEVTVLVQQRFAGEVETTDGAVCREFDVGASASIYRPAVVEGMLARRGMGEAP